MAVLTTGEVGSPPATGGGRRRVVVPREPRRAVPSGRAVVGGLLVALAALTAFVLARSGTDAAGASVVVAARGLPAGTVLAPDDLRTVRADLGPLHAAAFGDPAALVGRGLAAPVGAGELVPASAVTEAVEPRQRLEVDLSIPADRALQGRLRPGDLVDVFATWSDDVTEVVAVAATVVDAAQLADSGTVLGRTDAPVVLTLAVAEYREVEALVHAQAAGELSLVRSTFHEGRRPEVGQQYRPRVDEGDRAEDGGE